MNNPQILLTDAAIEAIKSGLEKRDTPDARVRLGLKGGGCSGFSYVIQYEDDLPKEKDLQFFFNGIRVIVDPKSMIYLDGIILDYDKMLLRSGFKFINKNEVSSCGCGKSFSTM
jgi:iron-sulfur cluster assembly protein